MRLTFTEFQAKTAVRQAKIAAHQKRVDQRRWHRQVIRAGLNPSAWPQAVAPKDEPLTGIQTPADVDKIQAAVAAANHRSLPRRERRARCRALGKQLGVTANRVFRPATNGPSFTAVESQIPHHKRKARLA